LHPNLIKVSILNWSKWNPRKDLKATSWLRFQNSIFEDPQFFDFDHSELLFFIYLLCQASKKQSGDVDIHISHAIRVCKFQREIIVSAIEKLVQIQCVRTRDVDVTSTNADVTLPSHYVTNETNVTERNETNVTPAPPESEESPALPAVTFDFESVYKLYPGREGKAVGMKRLPKLITSQADFDRFKKATVNYAEHCKCSGAYVKHFSTFVGTKDSQPWTDYEDFIPIIESSFGKGTAVGRESRTLTALEQAKRNRGVSS
jgi:hypothetical protein